MNRKLLIIGALSLVLVIPLLLVSGKIQERSSYREVARMNLATSWTDRQQVFGPVVLVPYRLRVPVGDTNAGDRSGTVVRNEYLVMLPQEFSAQGTVNVEKRRRGIYGIPVYDGDLHLTGRFSTQAIIELRARPDIVDIGAPVLGVAITDMRGIVDAPTIRWNGNVLDPEPGSGLPFQAVGFHAPLAALGDGDNGMFTFSIRLKLRGMSSLSIAPVGESTDVRLTANWPHPSFTGPYPPVNHVLTDEGFSANWRTTGLATNLADQAGACGRTGQCPPVLDNMIRVEMLEPVDIYVQADRATKYGFLFLGLSFATFLLFEIFGRAVLHPVQYGLVGLALCIFYLVLLSLAEHVTFLAAYVAGSLACGGLISAYVISVFADRNLAALFAGSLFGLYAVLYTIIQAEDYALIMGTTLLFTTLAAVMWTTRNVDWFAVNQRISAKK